MGFLKDLAAVIADIGKMELRSDRHILRAVSIESHRKPLAIDVDRACPGACSVFLFDTDIDRIVALWPDGNGLIKRE